MNDYLINKLKSLNIKRFLPRNNALANYKPFIKRENLIFISGQLPLTENGIENAGKIEGVHDTDSLKNAIEIATSNLLWNLSDCIEEEESLISNIYCCNIKGFFNCDEEFKDHPYLLNFSSNMIVDVLGEKVSIADQQSVFRVYLNSPVEIDYFLYIIKL